LGIPAAAGWASAKKQRENQIRSPNCE